MTIVAGVLFGWGLNRDRAQPYYTAAVHSMSRDWHDFVFGSFDPTGFITVDKVPGAFWIQALSVRLFGFHDWAVLLPQVLAATACVPLLYGTVRRWAGVRAGLIAAAVHTLTPITAALARTSIPDALMVFFLILAADAFWRWGQGGRAGWLAASAVWLGVAFNVKMGQALLVVPVFVGVCYLLGRGGRNRRVLRAGGFVLVQAAVSLVWMAFVSLTPASQRPFIDGSVHDSVWEMVFQYNGFGRLGGGSSGSAAPGGFLAGMGGSPGLGRLFGAQSAGQISWLIPAALLGLAVGLFAGRRSGTFERAGWLFWGGWFAVYAVAFCVASTIHTYYTTSLTPAIAALAGAGLAGAIRAPRYQLSAMVLATGLWAFAASLETPHYQVWLRWMIAVAVLAAVILVTWSRLVPALRTPAAIAVAAAMFAAPVVWTASVLFRGPDPMGAVAPAAGPPQPMFAGRTMAGLSPAAVARGLRAFEAGPDPTVTGFLLRHRSSQRFAAAVDGSMAATGYLAVHVPVLPMGGYTGDVPAPTAEGLAAMVRAGTVRYAVVGGLSLGRGTVAVGRDGWVKAHCRVVPGIGGSPLAGVVYDCGAG